MNRLMIVPAAGLGSRLNASTPKVLCPVNGKAMIDYLFDLYSTVVDHFVIVLHPSFAWDVRRHCAGRSLSIEYDFQQSPTGMLDAVLIPGQRVRKYAPRSIWVTWCDQISVHPQTVQGLADLSSRNPCTGLMFPTIKRQDPYIHLVRNENNDIVDILHRREGDKLPEVGESDLGLFCLSRQVYSELLPQFSCQAIVGAGTKERNFLPFIAWLQGRAEVKTFSGHDETESVGINTNDELRRVEHYLRNQ